MILDLRYLLQAEVRNISGNTISSPYESSNLLERSMGDTTFAQTIILVTKKYWMETIHMAIVDRKECILKTRINRNADGTGQQHGS